MGARLVRGTFIAFFASLPLGGLAQVCDAAYLVGECQGSNCAGYPCAACHRMSA